MISFNRLIQKLDIYYNETYKIVDLIAEEAPINAFVLDAGAGDQRYKCLFSKQHYVAADFVQVDKKYATPDIICDLLSIPLPDCSVDVILCTWVLEHVRDPEGVLKEFRRILKDEGVVHITAPQNHREHEIPHDYLRYTKYWFLYMQEKLSYNNVRVKNIGTCFHVLAHNIFLIPQNVTGYNPNIVGRAFKHMLYVFALPVAYLMIKISFLDKRRDFLLGYHVTYTK